MVRLFVLGAVAALALPAAAQSAPQLPAPQMRATTHPSATYVVPAGPGEAVRVTTYGRRPSVSQRLDRWRGVRVYRSPQAPVVAVPAIPAARVVRLHEGRVVRHGGASYPLVRR